MTGGELVLGLREVVSEPSQDRIPQRGKMSKKRPNELRSSHDLHAFIQPDYIFIRKESQPQSVRQASYAACQKTTLQLTGMRLFV